MPVVLLTLVTVNVCGVVEPHIILVEDGSVNETAGGVSIIVIFLILILFVPPLTAGMDETSKLEKAVAEGGNENCWSV